MYMYIYIITTGTPRKTDITLYWLGPPCTAANIFLDAESVLSQIRELQLQNDQQIVSNSSCSHLPRNNAHAYLHILYVYLYAYIHCAP